MSGWPLILVLAVTGGAIAYLGDKVGMKVGRKRLTLFGLRPRHTGMLITVLTGILIATATLTVLSMVSLDVRTALFGMQELKEAFRSQQVELKEKEQVQQVLAQQIIANEKELEQIRLERQEAEASVAQAQGRLDQLRLEYDDLHADLEWVRKELEVQTSRVEGLQEVESRLTREIEEAQRERALTQAVFERFLGGNIAFRTDEIVASRVIEGGRPKAQIEAEIQELLKEADEAALRRGARNPQGTDFKALRFLPADLNTLERLTNQLSEARGQFILRVVSWGNSVGGQPVVGYFQLFTERMIYDTGEEIVWAIIDGQKDPDQIFNEILQLLRQVNQTVVEKGMLTDRDGAVGEIATVGEVQEMIGKLREKRAPVRVSVQAAEPVWTTHWPMKVRLVLVDQ